MSELGLRRLRPRPRVILNIGITCIILSFVVPSGGVMQNPFTLFMGLGAFIGAPLSTVFTPLFCGPPLDDGQLTWYGIFSDGIVWAAWLTNFTIFFRLPTLISWIVIALPWVAFAFFFRGLSEFIPFYFWASGIGFIHLSRFLKPLPTHAY